MSWQWSSDTATEASQAAIYWDVESYIKDATTCVEQLHGVVKDSDNNNLMAGVVAYISE